MDFRGQGTVLEVSEESLIDSIRVSSSTFSGSKGTDVEGGNDGTADVYLELEMDA